MSGKHVLSSGDVPYEGLLHSAEHEEYAKSVCRTCGNYPHHGAQHRMTDEQAALAELHQKLSAAPLPDYLTTACSECGGSGMMAYDQYAPNTCKGCGGRGFVHPDYDYRKEASY